jgi:predicted transcriptional regulator
MAANLRFQMEGEQNRVLILEHLKGKELSAVDMAFSLGMSKQKLENYLRSLLRSGHIVNSKMVKNRFFYKRTNKPFYTMAMKDEQIDAQYKEVEATVVTPMPYARVVKLLDKKREPAPKSKKSKGHMYGGMQSSMQSFGGW